MEQMTKMFQHLNKKLPKCLSEKKQVFNDHQCDQQAPWQGCQVDGYMLRKRYWLIFAISACLAP